MTVRSYTNKCYVDVECPICDAEWTVFWSLDKNYGADADGRRGRDVLLADIDKRGCTHGVEEDVIEKSQDEAEDVIY